MAIQFLSLDSLAGERNTVSMVHSALVLSAEIASKEPISANSDGIYCDLDTYLP